MNTYSSNWSSAASWLTEGIPFHIAGNGGPECTEYLSPGQRLAETVCWAIVLSGLALLGWNIKQSPARAVVSNGNNVISAKIPASTGRDQIMTLMGLVFGIEIGFKLASKQLLWLLNPCHVMTAIQLYLLSTPNSPWTTPLFRTHIYFLNGPLLAILFPVTNSFFFPLEVEIYWIQHIMILVVPFYLLRLGGSYNLEPLSDFGWVLFAYGAQTLYHWLVLQPLGLVFSTNLNSIICPAISDPFHGPNYRSAAMFHQGFLIPLLGKGYLLCSDFLITKFSLTKSKEYLCDQIKAD